MNECHWITHLEFTGAQAKTFESIAKIFKRHGAQLVNTPLLLPKTQHLQLASSTFTLLDHRYCSVH